MQVAMLAGEIDFAFDTTAAVPHIKAGKFRALAMTEDTRGKVLEPGTGVDPSC